MDIQFLSGTRHNVVLQKNKVNLSLLHTQQVLGYS